MSIFANHLVILAIAQLASGSRHCGNKISVCDWESRLPKLCIQVSAVILLCAAVSDIFALLKRWLIGPLIFVQLCNAWLGISVHVVALSFFMVFG